MAIFSNKAIRHKRHLVNHNNQYIKQATINLKRYVLTFTACEILSIVQHQEIYIHPTMDSHRGGPGRVLLFGEVRNVILARLNQIRNLELTAEFDLIEPYQHRTFTLQEHLEY